MLSEILEECALLEPNRDIRDSFCIYPFLSMNVMPNGAVKPCCAFGRSIEKNGQSMSVYEHTVEEIWNSADMRDIRRSMIEGRPVAGCNYCYEQERKNLRSMWTVQTENWKSGVLNPLLETIDRLKERVSADNYEVPAGAEWLDLDMGNLCNLRCRMCNASYSSKIANDPIHSRWTGLPQAPLRWQGKSCIIAPRQMLGVTYEGFQQPEFIEGSQRSWTNGDAAVRLDIRGLDIVGLSVRLSGDKTAHDPVTITANGKTLFHGGLPSSSLRSEFEAPFLHEATELELRIKSPVVAHATAAGFAGVGVEEIRLMRSSTGPNTVALSRFAGGAQWYQEQTFLTGELLGSSQQMKKIGLIGGEPLLIKEVRHIMRHLVETDAAHNIVLVLTTNGTCGDDEWFDLAARFAAVYVAISVDGFGRVNEYIRFPSNWRTIEENIARFKSQQNTIVDINTTVQAYNILDIVELVTFCDRNGLGFRGHFLQYPNYLSPSVLPFEIRQVAAERLRTYAKTCGAPPARRLPSALEAAPILRTSSAEALQALASALEGGPRDVDLELLRRFMSFTNDLDASRGQNFAGAFSELHGMIEDLWFPWIRDLSQC